MLQKIKESAEIRQSDKMKKIDDKRAKTEREIECEEASAHLAKKYGDDESAEIHSKKSEKAKDKAKAIEGEKKKASSKTAKATSKDLGVSSPLSHNKIQSLYIDLIAAIIENEGFDNEGNSYGLNLELLSPIAEILKEIMDGNKESLDVLIEHCALVIEEDEAEAVESDGAEDSEGDEEDEEDEEGEDEDEEVADEDENEEIADEDDTPIELEREFQESSVNDEDFD